MKNNMQWYSVFVSPMREQKAKMFLQDRIIISNMEEYFGDILIPIEKKKSEKTGRMLSKKIFPGYMFVQMAITDESVALVKNTRYVKNILSHGTKTKYPSSLTSDEVQYIIKLSKGELQTKNNVFEPGQAVRVVKGFLSDLQGIVEKVDNTKNLCKVSINILGRNLSFDIDFANMIPEVE